MSTETARVKTRSLSAGCALLRDPNLNKGIAFTAEERASLGLQGLLPAAVLSLGVAGADFDRIVDPKSMVGDPRHDLSIEPGSHSTG